MIDFFMMLNCLFNNDSSQLALKDVLERRNSLKLRSWRVAALTHPASVLLPEFWPRAPLDVAIFCDASFRARRSRQRDVSPVHLRWHRPSVPARACGSWLANANPAR